MAGIGLGWITVAAQGHLPMIMQKERLTGRIYDLHRFRAG